MKNKQVVVDQFLVEFRVQLEKIAFETKLQWLKEYDREMDIEFYMEMLEEHLMEDDTFNEIYSKHSNMTPDQKEKYWYGYGMGLVEVAFYDDDEF